MKSNSQNVITNFAEEKKKLENKVKNTTIIIAVSIVLLLIGCWLILFWVNLLQLGIGITLIIIPLPALISNILTRRKLQKTIGGG